MSNDAIAPGLGAQFTLKSLVAVHVNNYTVNLYLVVEETMEVRERAQLFHVNKAALALHSIPARLQLDAFLCRHFDRCSFLRLL